MKEGTLVIARFSLNVYNFDRRIRFLTFIENRLGYAKVVDSLFLVSQTVYACIHEHEEKRHGGKESKSVKLKTREQGELSEGFTVARVGDYTRIAINERKEERVHFLTWTRVFTYARTRREKKKEPIPSGGIFDIQQRAWLRNDRDSSVVGRVEPWSHHRSAKRS